MLHRYDNRNSRGTSDWWITATVSLVHLRALLCLRLEHASPWPIKPWVIDMFACIIGWPWHPCSIFWASMYSYSSRLHMQVAGCCFKCQGLSNHLSGFVASDPESFPGPPASSSATEGNGAAMITPLRATSVSKAVKVTHLLVFLKDQSFLLAVRGIQW